MPYPVRITGKSVTLREFTMGDVDDALEIVGDDRVTGFLSFDSRDREATHAMLRGAVQRAQDEPRTEYYLGVTVPPGDRVIGFARLGLGGVKAAKLGYAIAWSEWGNGYATDAAKTLVDYGFNELLLHRITAAIGPDNLASIEVVRKLGFTQEGSLREHVFTNGMWRDSILFSLLEGDPRGADAIEPA